MDERTVEAIEEILRRGNDAEVRRKGGGYVVLEVKKKIISAPAGLAAGKGNRS